MSTIIKKIDEGILEVNGKTVQQDADGDWVAKFDELTPAEQRALHNYLKALKD